MSNATNQVYQRHAMCEAVLCDMHMQLRCIGNTLHQVAVVTYHKLLYFSLAVMMGSVRQTAWMQRRVKSDSLYMRPAKNDESYTQGHGVQQ